MSLNIPKLAGSSLILSLFLTIPVLAQSLSVPFILQAPQHNWVQPFEDACEEASMLMVNNFYQGIQKLTEKQAANAILKIVKFENKHFGFNKDTNAKQTAEFINLYLPYEAKVVENPTLELIKTELDVKHPMIIPLYGKALKNPSFKNGGPDYHMVVISGYDDSKNEFIVQEPGIGKGKNYRYLYTTLLNANHDFLSKNNTKNGVKVVIFTTPDISTSSDTDGDIDGLVKKDEIIFGTDLMNPDTDNDGFTDGAEIKSGYSPIVNENHLANNSLIKTTDSPNIYLLQNKLKQHILNEIVFAKHNWNFKKVIIVSNKFINNLKTDSEISK